MSFPLRRRFPPLTRRRLQEIQQQYGHDPVVRRLLWEIRCLQIVIMRARQLEQSLPPGEGTADTRQHSPLPGARENNCQRPRATRDDLSLPILHVARCMNQALDLFAPVVPQSRLCESFKRIAGRATAGDKALLQSWIEGFVDRDGKFVQELQTTFNSSFWELYLHAALVELGFSVDYRFSRPDFVVSAPIDFCVEAVTAQPAGTTRLDPGTIEDIESSMKDLNELNRKAIVRLANAFHSKYRKLTEDYSSLAHVAGKPFILAIAAFDGPAFFALSTRPIEALLYNRYVDEEAFISGQRDTLDGQFLEAVTKDNGASIQLGVFGSDAHSEISAVIYNPAATWGKVRSMSALVKGERVVVNQLRYNPHSHLPHHVVGMKGTVSETLLDGTFVFHNPYASKPLSPGLFRNNSVAQVYLDPASGDLFHHRREGHLLFRHVVTHQTRK